MTLSEPSTPVAEPVRMTVRVRRNIQDTFDLFTRDIGSWWPLDKASFGGDRASELHLEPFVGGRFYERYIDGEEHIGGRVLRWEPPRLIAYTWQHDDWAAPTEVEVRFFAEEPFLTRVELEHRAWERLGPTAERMREMYNNGWPTVITCFDRSQPQSENRPSNCVTSATQDQFRKLLTLAGGQSDQRDMRPARRPLS